MVASLNETGPDAIIDRLLGKGVSRADRRLCALLADFWMSKRRSLSLDDTQ